ENGQAARGVGTSEVSRCVAYHPYRLVGGNSRATQSVENRVRRRLVARAVAGPDGARYPALPAQMGDLGAQVVTDLVAHDCNVAPEVIAAREQRGGTRQGLQPLQMDAVEGLVEHPLGFSGARPEQGREGVAQRAVRTTAHLLGGPGRQAQGRERVVV